MTKIGDVKIFDTSDCPVVDITVPTADSTDNVDMVDVIGNKSDTVSGTSITALIKQAIAKIIGAAGVAVPSLNSSDNVSMRDVIGNKTDDESGTSLKSDTYTLKAHAHSVQLCAPTLADGLTMAASVTPWTLGNFIVVIATNAVTSPFDIHQVHVGNFSANDVYELALYQGANGVETVIARIRFTRTSNNNPGSVLPVTTPLIPANTQIKAKLASKAGSSTANFSVMYHTY
jgi:hypothetical protein